MSMSSIHVRSLEVLGPRLALRGNVVRSLELAGPFCFAGGGAGHGRLGPRPEARRQWPALVKLLSETIPGFG